MHVGAFVVLGHGAGEHLDVVERFGGGPHQEVAVLDGAARADGLKHVLHGHADFAFDPAAGLLEGLCETGIGVVDAHLALEGRSRKTIGRRRRVMSELRGTLSIPGVALSSLVTGPFHAPLQIYLRRYAPMVCT